MSVVLSVLLNSLRLTNKEAEVTHAQMFGTGHAKVLADLADRLRVFFAVLAHNPGHLWLLDQGISLLCTRSIR